jgi:hypothetical protein
VFANGILREMFRGEVTGDWRKLELDDLYSLPNIRMIRAWHILHMREKKCVHGFGMRS